MNNPKAGDICPQCKAGRLAEKTGKYGTFVACSNFPDCKYIVKEERAKPVDSGIPCDKCGQANLVIREGKFGKFLACPRYPKCQNTKKIGSDGRPMEPRPRF